MIKNEQFNTNKAANWHGDYKVRKGRGNSIIFIARWKGLEYIVKLYSDKNQDAEKDLKEK